MTTLRACVLAAADALEAARVSLSELDGIAGDGDHGATMTLAAREARKRLAAQPEVDGAQLLTAVAGAMGSVGGAIGPIYASALARIASRLSELGEQGDTRLNTDALAACAEAAEDGVTRLGGAKPGDKTLLDALHPLVEALRVAAKRGDDPLDAARAGAAACRRGAESTSGMIASVGRASRLGERSRGFADPGATSLAIVIDALVDAASGAGPSDGASS